MIPMNKLTNILVALAGLLALAVVLGNARPVSACPLCRDAVAAPDEGSSIEDEEDALREPRAWNRSIYLFVSMPYLLLGGFAFFVYRALKRAPVPTPPSAAKEGSHDRIAEPSQVSDQRPDAEHAG
jgi:hypothetical protein